MCKVWC